MIHKILTKNSTDNTNIDGARAEHFNAGMRDGIVKGAFNEGTFTTLASNEISFDTCELRISGHRVVIEEAWSRTFSSKPVTPIRYALIGQIIVGEDSSVQFELFPQLASTAPIKNNLFRQQNGAGTYQVEIGRFTLNTDGNIIDVTRTLDIITGSKGEDLDGTINIGVVKTNTLEPEMDAEADVEQRYDAEQGKVLTDFTFSIPRGKGLEDLDTELSESSTNAVQNNVITTAIKERAKLKDNEQVIEAKEIKTKDNAIIGGSLQFSSLENSTKKLLLDFQHPVNSIIEIEDDTFDPNVYYDGTGSVWERLPDGYVLWSASSGAGTTIPAGLPNITGQDALSWNGVNNGLIANTSSDQRGAFLGTKLSKSNGNYYSNQATSISQSVPVGVGFDASKGEVHDGVYRNDIYGKSETVQPPARKTCMWKRIS